MLQEVKINGFSYFADVNNSILYEDRDRTKGIPFSYLTRNEKEQMESELRFPRKKEKVEY